MTTFLLVRHGETDAVGKLLAGWQTGWSLNNNGKQQVANLTQRLSHLKIRAIYTSPLERAIETAQAIAEPHNLTPIIRHNLGEFRFGEWEGRSFESLRPDSQWQHFNASRSVASPPGGEWMIEVQSRMVRESDEIRKHHPDETVALVSHGDPLRALIAYYLGSPLDLLQRFEINPASLTAVRFDGDQPSILWLNHTGDLQL